MHVNLMYQSLIPMYVDEEAGAVYGCLYSEFTDVLQVMAA